MKLLDECHKRGIYPDGKTTGSEKLMPARKSVSYRKQSIIASVIVIVVCVLLTALFATISIRNHKDDGYYKWNDTSLYYRYGSTWYYNDQDNWQKTENVPFVENQGDCFLGEDFQSDWGGSDFRTSEVYKDLQERNSSSSSDYESWDSDDTDLDSDW